MSSCAHMAKHRAAAADDEFLADAGLGGAVAAEHGDAPEDLPDPDAAFKRYM